MIPADLAAMTAFETLLPAPGVAVRLPAPFDAVLAELHLPPPGQGRPAVVVNFVASLDGAVRLSTQDPDSTAVALGSKHDWLLLGLLRSLATTIVVGAEPLRQGRSRQDGAAALRGLATEVQALRAGFGLGPLHHVVLCGSGNLPVDNPVWRGPATVVTTETGARELARRGLPGDVAVVVDPAPDGARVSPATAVAAARAATPVTGAGPVPAFVLAEPGPALFAELLAAHLVDELFLTISPLLAGPAEGRLSLVGSPLHATLDLAGLARAGSHLFTRWHPHRVATG